MKKLIFLISILILTIGCSGKKDELTNMLDSVKEKTQKVDTNDNIGKYNAYVGLYNYIGGSNDQIINFTEEYSNAILDKDGNVKKVTDMDIVGFSVALSAKYMSMDKMIEEVESKINEKPSYPFDNDVKKLIETMKNIKSKTLEISNYYQEKFYKDDNYEKGKILDEEFQKLYNEYVNDAKKVQDSLKELMDKTVEKDLKELEKSKSVARLNMMKILIEFNKVSDILSAKENLKFTPEEVAKMKEINTKITEIYSNLEKVTTNDLEKESVNESNYKRFLTNSKQTIDYLGSLVQRIEKNESEQLINDRIEDYYNSSDNLVDVYNSFH